MSSLQGVFRWPVLVALAACASIPAAYSQDGQPQARPRLDVAVDGKQLSIELDAPAQNVVGFGYEPFTVSERQASEQATQWLQAGHGLFETPDEAGCQLAASLLQPPDWARRRQEQRENTEAAREVFQDDKIEASATPHADYRARYRFECAHPDKLEWVDAKLMERLKGGIRFHAQVVAPEGQKQQLVSKDATRIALK